MTDIGKTEVQKETLYSSSSERGLGTVRPFMRTSFNRNSQRSESYWSKAYRAPEEHWTLCRWTVNVGKMSPLLSSGNGSVYCLFLWDLWQRSDWREHSGFFSKKQMKAEQNHELRAWTCRVPILPHAVLNGTGAAIYLNFIPFMKLSSAKFNTELTLKLGQHRQLQPWYVIFEVYLCRARWMLWSLWRPSNSKIFYDAPCWAMWPGKRWWVLTPSLLKSYQVCMWDAAEEKTPS